MMLILVPFNLKHTTEWYERQGFRILAFAYKQLVEESWEEVSELSREELEKDAEFAGLMIMRNQLKHETIATLQILQEAHIPSIMCTGNENKHS